MISPTITQSCGKGGYGLANVLNTSSNNFLKHAISKGHETYHDDTYQVCHFRHVKCNHRPGGQVVKTIGLKSLFEISVSQKENQ